CKLNQAEVEVLARRFAQAGYVAIDPKDGPDIYILNTCTVTHVADRKSRQLLRQARRANPHGLIVATGCYAQRARQDLEDMPEVSLVVDNTAKMQLPEILNIDVIAPMDEAAIPTTRTRSMVKIQEGCNQVCSYCIVPKTRGRERSVPINELITVVKNRVASGYREVVLTGTQLGSYGFEFGPEPSGLSWHEALVRRIINETGVDRLRMSSLQPQEITPGFIDLYAKGLLCPHLHMPLQSGSDNVLKRMRRRYTTAMYKAVTEELVGIVPDISITTDVIVGFPGETDSEFEGSLEFIEELPISAAHVFPYSKRPGTSAAFLSEHVEPGEKRAREGRMLELVQRKNKAYLRRFVGRTAMVLWEGQRNVEGRGYWTGLTENYMRAYRLSGEALNNQITMVGLEGELGDGLRAHEIGRLV
ncbi:tRNA (N(6)-L-threonylcarbamoyladenosine(37)-C(2))-methylthiotransferase MtaB, partial [Dehalococcoidia bacterium]|nr:tRNA (N(6)-L-threonylcarbamoyladenosine(37)-C(2))-methylthiotransferase MtaB [Dehalococcoidia bacterium]